ncbi:TPA: DUF6236 family protein [Klebsiella pneumoniae]|nr:hypothetical protein [Klebsiella pneumoniae]
MKNKIIIQNGFSYRSTENLSIRMGLLPDGLISKVLYWDNVINLKTKFFESKDAKIIELLTNEGIFQDEYFELSPVRRTSTSNMVPTFLNSIQNKVITLLKDKSTNYITENLPFEYINNNSETDISGGCILHMVNTIPLPDDSTDIEKVLEFRLKRSDQLRLLINHINSLSIRVESSTAPGTELRKAMNDIDLACAEAIRIYKENNIKINHSNIKINFNIKDIMKVAAATYGGASLIMPQTAAAFSGIVAGAASTVDWQDAISIKKIDTSNPFNYVAQAIKI